MKKVGISLLLTLFLLSGCDAGDSGITHVFSLTPPSETAAPPELAGLYAAGSAIELQTNRAVLAYPLPMEDAYHIRAMGENLLVFSGQEHTTVTLLKGTQLTVGGSVTISGFLDPEDPSVRIREDRISFQESSTGDTLILDSQLRLLHRIPRPDGLTGSALLSRDEKTLYYCTETGIYAWDLETGLHRLLKEMRYGQQTLSGLHMDDQVLCCRIVSGNREQTLFLSCQNGQLLHTQEGNLRLTDLGSRYWASFPGGTAQTLVFGEIGSRPQILLPQDPAGPCTFLIHRQSAVTVSVPAGGSVVLDHYDLTTGLRSASLTLNESQFPLAVEDTGDGRLFLLVKDPQFGCPTLYLWDTATRPLTDRTVYTGDHYTARDPDAQGLSGCQAYAEALGEKYGITIRIWEDAAAVQPWDYDLEPEYLVHVLMSQLRTLDRCLSRYPASMLTDTAAHFSSLSICLVRSITGSAESGCTDPVTGVQFLAGSDAYVVVAAGEFMESSLYHELFHVMETHIFGNSIAFDQWDSYNPAGFRYDYSYLTNKTRDSGVYLQRTGRAFVDTYSMSFPKEDRARIMEYAMLPGNEALFQSPILQRKLLAICTGIREAYGLEKCEDSFLWEQYLA